LRCFDPLWIFWRAIEYWRRNISLKQWHVASLQIDPSRRLNRRPILESPERSFISLEIPNVLSPRHGKYETAVFLNDMLADCGLVNIDI
jgi:hypothetical protein